MIGRTLGHYRVLEKLGEGGMGVVYRAQDLHLDRLVALKILPPEQVADSERKARFVQEAKTASALNHPHIITVYDIDQQDGVDFIAMEYVAGRTLDRVIPRAGMRLNEALRCAVQMADALAKAHAAGIVHRDLKPGNVMVTDDGRIKVLDFGLAKLTEAAPLGGDDPTRTAKPTTEAGTIVGTVAYMSPEQAEGKKVDARSDIFSFGAVLYEMLTGRQAFHKESKSSTLGAIIHTEPEPLGAEVPQELSRIITRCLRKDPERRFQLMKDLKVELEELKEESDSGKRAGTAITGLTRSRRWVWAAAAAAVVLFVAALLVWQSQEPPPRDNLTAAPLTTYAGIETQPSFSPDGTKIAFSWNGEREDNDDIYVHQIGLAGTPMRLTTSTAAESYPAWSPDDRWIAFARAQPDRGNVAVQLIPPLGGPERTLTEMTGVNGLGWTPDGKWVVLGGRDSAEDWFGIWAIALDTGERRRLTTAVATAQSPRGSVLGDAFPSVSPDGRTLAFSRHGAGYVVDVCVLPLTKDLHPVGGPRTLTNEHYGCVSGLAWTPDGREIVYAGGGDSTHSLYRVSASGEQTPKRLSYATLEALFPTIASETSRLAYTLRVTNANLWRLDTRTGEHKLFIGSTYESDIPQYSPDGRRIAFQSNRSGSVEVWICEVDGSNCLKLTSFGGPQCGTPRWSADSRWLALDSRVEGSPEIYVMAADGGTPHRVTTRVEGVSNQVPSWSRDGHWIYFASNRSGGNEIWKLPVAGGKPVAGAQAVQVTRSGGGAPQVSVDGQYLYYVKEPGPGVFRMPAAGGEEQQVVPGRINNWAAFSVTAKGVYFVTGLTLKFVDAMTGRVSTVADLPMGAGGSSFGLAVSPDDRYVVYSKLDRNTTDLMLVENFR